MAESEMTLTSPQTERRHDSMTTLEYKLGIDAAKDFRNALAHYQAEAAAAEGLKDTARLEYILQRFPQTFAAILEMRPAVEYTLAEFRAGVDAARSR